jgi:hypothetical protein
MTRHSTEPLSQRAFARAVGLSQKRVQELTGEGLPTLDDGRIDFDAGRRWIAKNVDAERSRRRRSAPAAYPTTAEARRAKTAAAAARAELALARERGELVERAKVERTIFTLVRAERDAWLAFAACAAPEIAADLRIDPEPLRRALARRIRAELDRRASPRLARRVRPRISIKK